MVSELLKTRFELLRDLNDGKILREEKEGQLSKLKRLIIQFKGFQLERKFKREISKLRCKSVKGMKASLNSYLDRVEKT